MGFFYSSKREDSLRVQDDPFVELCNRMFCLWLIFIAALVFFARRDLMNSIWNDIRFHIGL